jgi:hypothetical protein
MLLMLVIGWKVCRVKPGELEGLGMLSIYLVSINFLRKGVGGGMYYFITLRLLCVLLYILFDKFFLFFLVDAFRLIRLLVFRWIFKSLS